MVDFAERYATQNARDHAALIRAITTGQVDSRARRTTTASLGVRIEPVSRLGCECRSRPLPTPTHHSVTGTVAGPVQATNVIALGTAAPAMIITWEG